MLLQLLSLFYGRSFGPVTFFPFCPEKRVYKKMEWLIGAYSFRSFSRLTVHVASCSSSSPLYQAGITGQWHPKASSFWARGAFAIAELEYPRKIEI